MNKSKVTAKEQGIFPGVRWVVLLFVGILVGGTAVVLDRRFDLVSPWVDAVVGASIVTVLISFLGFMARLRD